MMRGMFSASLYVGMITRIGTSVAEIGASSSIWFWLVSGGVGWLNGSLFLVFDLVRDCPARNARSARIAPLERTYFVVERGRKACSLPPPQCGAWRDPVFAGCRTGLPDPSDYCSKAAQQCHKRQTSFQPGGDSDGRRQGTP